MTGFEVGGPIFVVTGDDGGGLHAARQATKQQVAFYGSTPAYRGVLELHGWGEIGDELNTMSKRGLWVEMGDLITDDMLETFAVVAEPDDVAPMLRARYGPLVDRISFYTPVPRSHPTQSKTMIAAMKD